MDPRARRSVHDQHAARASYASIDQGVIAAVVARVLLKDGHQAQRYELTGPESLTKLDLVRTIGEAIGRGIRF